MHGAARLASWPFGITTLLSFGVIDAVIFAEFSSGSASFYHLLIGLGVFAMWLAAVPGARPFRRRGAEMTEFAARLERGQAAEAANTAKSRYLANVSHEIRSPLNAIYGYAQLIELSDQVSAREAARVIRRSAEHLTSLVEGLLDISQLENGVMRVKSDVVDLREFIDQICWMLRPDALAKGLEFNVELSERLPELVRMDQSRFRQVLINLLSNAIKFTDRGSVSLRVRYSSQIAVFEIADTGPGIAAADRDRIFAPFERGGGEDGQHRPGIGLGLPIAKAIVEILGGQIELESEPGNGTCFRVTMMLSEVAPAATGLSQLAAPARRITGHEGGKRSILLVDDDVQQLSFMRALLDSVGFVVTAVPNGETAVALCRGETFDLAILDITLPGISGWDTAVQIRELLGDGVHIIMLSANVQEYHRPATQQPVHDIFLVKPVEFNTLLEAVGGLLGITWKREDAAAAPLAPPRSGDLPAAALPYVAQIREDLSIGHYRGVEKGIRELAEQVPEAAELAASLLDCLDRFDLSAMARKLEDC